MSMGGSVVGQSAQGEAGKEHQVIWYNKFTCCVIALLLWKTLAVFDGYWWEETSLMAGLTLLVAAFIEVILPAGYRAPKALFQAVITAVVIAVTASAYGDVVWQGMPADNGSPISWLEIQFAHLSPFIWICAALLLIYTMFIHWVTTRTRLFAVLTAVLLTLTIADSFTPVWLWDDVAWVVLTGLLWLVADHLAGFQRSNPGSWKALLRSPLQLFLPVTAVLAVLMVGGLIMPSISPVLQDPYTIWKESKGESVETFIGDKGNTSTPVLPSSDTSSGYGRNDQNLGGGFNYDYSPVMTVQSTQRSYWRGETKEIYTHDGWYDFESAHDPERLRTDSVRFGTELPAAEETKLAEVVQVEQIVTMMREDSYPVLFGASAISKVNWLNDPDASTARTRLYWSPEDSEVRLYAGPDIEKTRNEIDYPGSYSVTSEVVVLDEDKLRETHAGRVDGLDSQYYELPDDMPVRVKELAEQITAGAANDYDKAKMIEQYLRSAYPYTNQPDLSKLNLSLSMDFVDQFLFELKEGYCDYFSTAMAVMGRAVGLPTRWVKGFAPGALPVVSGPGGLAEEGIPEMNADGSGTYTVRNSDAHSWVEIYYEGFGWIPFEPTSGFSYPYSVPEAEDTPAPTAAPETEDTPDTPMKEEAGIALPLRLIGWIAAGLLAAAAAVYAFVNRQAIASMWEQYRFRSFTANDRIVWETERLLRRCRRKGLVRAEHETLREAVSRWSDSNGKPKLELIEVMDIFEKAKYSTVKASADEAERFARKIKAVIGQVK